MTITKKLLKPCNRNRNNFYKFWGTESEYRIWFSLLAPVSEHSCFVKINPLKKLASKRIFDIRPVKYLVTGKKNNNNY